MKNKRASRFNKLNYKYSRPTIEALYPYLVLGVKLRPDYEIRNRRPSVEEPGNGSGCVVVVSTEDDKGVFVEKCQSYLL